MAKPQHFPALAAFLAATAGRDMTRAAYAAVALGMSAVVLLTIDAAYEAARRGIIALLWGCLAFFVFEWAVRVHHAARMHRPAAYLLSGRGLLDAASAIMVPIALLVGTEPRAAWLFAVTWVVKVVPGVPGLRQLRRVMVV